MKIVWTRLAIDDLRAIRTYVEFDAPRAAVKVALRILRAVTRLEKSPSIGRPGRVLSTRELVLIEVPYIVAYRVTADVVEVLRLLHTSRRWPKRLNLVRSKEPK